MKLLPLFAAGILALSGCAGAPHAVPPSGGTPIPPRGSTAVPRPGPAAIAPSPPEIAGTRFIRVLLPGGTREVVLEGKSIRAWGVDGRPVAEAAGRVTLAAVGERIRWNGSRLLGGALDAAGAPDLRVGKREVAGRVRLLARRGDLLAVAVVPLEAYVAAVLSREAPRRFHPEALAALAVAVRTYAAGAAAKPRDPAYDVVGSVEDQVFDGTDGVAAVFRQAADRTRGLVVLYRGELARTVYHSTCGGRTESAEYAWGKDIPYLRSQLCDDCADSPVYRWEYRMSGAEGRRVARELGVPPGKDLRIAVTGRTPTGRAIRVRISSGGVSRELQAAEFRKAAGYARVRSLKMEIVAAAGEWRITGEGWGHGVGMCQFGANGMARRGAGFREILARYYPGTDISVESP
ncbi:MAG: SpoIID/LytB domain-containing protein [Desulfobacteria bacterium]|nr:SpoIID/LytB domain-containing protein [Deltaproteobacteria bacterium]